MSSGPTRRKSGRLATPAKIAYQHYREAAATARSLSTFVTRHSDNHSGRRAPLCVQPSTRIYSRDAHPLDPLHPRRSPINPFTQNHARFACDVWEKGVLFHEAKNQKGMCLPLLLIVGEADGSRTPAPFLTRHKGSTTHVCVSVRGGRAGARCKGESLGALFVPHLSVRI